jgi:hypothetical protein
VCEDRSSRGGVCVVVIREIRQRSVRDHIVHSTGTSTGIIVAMATSRTGHGIREAFLIVSGFPGWNLLWIEC